MALGVWVLIINIVIIFILSYSGLKYALILFPIESYTSSLYDNKYFYYFRYPFLKGLLDHKDFLVTFEEMEYSEMERYLKYSIFNKEYKKERCFYASSNKRNIIEIPILDNSATKNWLSSPENKDIKYLIHANNQDRANRLTLVHVYIFMPE